MGYCRYLLRSLSHSLCLIEMTGKTAAAVRYIDLNALHWRREQMIYDNNLAKRKKEALAEGGKENDNNEIM